METLLISFFPASWELFFVYFCVAMSASSASLNDGENFAVPGASKLRRERTLWFIPTIDRTAIADVNVVEVSAISFVVQKVSGNLFMFWIVSRKHQSDAKMTAIIIFLAIIALVLPLTTEPTIED